MTGDLVKELKNLYGDIALQNKVTIEGKSKCTWLEYPPVTYLSQSATTIVKKQRPVETHHAQGNQPNTPVFHSLVSFNNYYLNLFHITTHFPYRLEKKLFV
jgi:hypothetical protein